MVTVQGLQLFQRWSSNETTGVDGTITLIPISNLIKSTDPNLQHTAYYMLKCGQFKVIG